MCYLIEENLYETLETLSEFTSKCQCQVDVFTESPLIALSRNGLFVKSYSQRLRRFFDRRIKLRLGAGPEEFVRSIEDADWVVSDSFHALMFSIINNCNARIIKPKSEKRAKMFSRVQEFSDHTKGPLISSSLHDALRSLANSEKVAYDASWLKASSESSEQWLISVLNVANYRR